MIRLSSLLFFPVRALLTPVISVLIQHEAERQAWTHAPQCIHKHYALQARLPPPSSAPASSTAAEWHAILVCAFSMPPLRQPLIVPRGLHATWWSGGFSMPSCLGDEGSDMPFGAHPPSHPCSFTERLGQPHCQIKQSSHWTRPCLTA